MSILRNDLLRDKTSKHEGNGLRFERQQIMHEQKELTQERREHINPVEKECAPIKHKHEVCQRKEFPYKKDHEQEKYKQYEHLCELFKHIKKMSTIPSKEKGVSSRKNGTNAKFRFRLGKFKVDDYISIIKSKDCNHQLTYVPEILDAPKVFFNSVIVDKHIGKSHTPYKQEITGKPITLKAEEIAIAPDTSDLQENTSKSNAVFIHSKAIVECKEQEFLDVKPCNNSSHDQLELTSAVESPPKIKLELFETDTKNEPNEFEMQEENEDVLHEIDEHNKYRQQQSIY